MKVQYFTFQQFHNKRNIGSTRIRVDNLIKYWPEASLYRYGDNPDVLIYQKVYMTMDYAFAKHYKGMQILDVCDPDWHNNPDIFIRQTLDCMDAVTVPTAAMRDFLQAMTTTPVYVVPDRFDLAEFPPPKRHEGNAKKVVWYGYSHNAEAMKFAMPSIERRGLDLLIISNEDPFLWRWVEDQRAYQDKYKFIKYEHPNAYNDLQQADICILPQGMRPLDKLKSNNKSVVSQLCGIPVATDAEELDKLQTASQRNKAIETVYDTLRAEYDCQKSVKEMKAIINEIKTKRD